MDDTTKNRLRELLACKGDDLYAPEGDGWIRRFNYDESELCVDELTDAIMDFIESEARRG